LQPTAAARQSSVSAATLRAEGRTIAELREITSGLKAVSLAFCT
jgi:hypothetical protein